MDRVTAVLGCSPDRAVRLSAGRVRRALGGRQLGGAEIVAALQGKSRAAASFWANSWLGTDSSRTSQQKCEGPCRTPPGSVPA